MNPCLLIFYLGFGWPALIQIVKNNFNPSRAGTANSILVFGGDYVITFIYIYIYMNRHIYIYIFMYTCAWIYM